MKNTRVVVSRHGGPEVLKPIQEDLPQPGAGEVRIKVLAAGVSAYDLMFRASGVLPGTPKPPFTLGEDVVGVVDEVGPAIPIGDAPQSAAKRPPGDAAGPERNLLPVMRVAAATFVKGLGGDYAEYLCLPADELVPVPDGIDPAEAVCLVVNYLTAHMAMHRTAAVAPGERVVVHGGAGGVGSALLDLGRHAGLAMYATASLHGHELVSSYGAIPIDYHREDFVGRVRELAGDGVDVVFDPVGGARHLVRSNRALRRGGRLVWFGMAATKRHGLRVILTTLAMRALLAAVPTGKSAPLMRDLGKEREWRIAALAGLLELLRDRKIRPAVAARIPLLEAHRAHELLERGGYAGKVVLVTESGTRNRPPVRLPPSILPSG